MATLRELREAVFPAAAAMGSPDPALLEAAVGWVRVLRARVPAFDILEPGDLVIVPGRALAIVAPTSAERAELVEAFVRASLAGVVVASIPGGESGGLPSARTNGEVSAAPTGSEADLALAEAVAASGLPAFRSVGVDPGALERSLIGVLVNRRAELEHQAGRLEERVQALALGDADLSSLVAEIGAFLGRAVALEGRRGDRLAVHATADDLEVAAAVGRYLAGTGTAALRVPLPAAGERAAREGSRAVAGWLVLLGDRPPTELERIAAGRIAGSLALELARDEAVRRASDAARRDVLPDDGPPWVVLVARQVGPDAARPVEAREETRRELRLLAPARRLALRGSAESLEVRAVLAADRDDPSGSILAARVAALLGRPVALSSSFSSPAERPPAEADARATLEAIETLSALEPGAGPTVARADQLPAYRLLGALHNVPDGPRLARALLAPLLEGRPSAVRERLATLRAVLDGRGPAETAASLGIHRNTLAYRVRRIEALSGWQLGDPTLRLPLSVAVRIVQDAQDGERAARP